MDEWLNSVTMNRCGDILCVFLLSIVTGCHACIHLKNGCMWSTLHTVPVDHDEHVNLCDLHLVYLGFGAFLRLVPRPALDLKESNLPILGYVVGEDPETQLELTRKAIKEEPSHSRTATVAAGSTQQLSRVERELNMPIILSSSSTSSDKFQQTPCNLLALCKPVSVKLVRLSKSEIEKRHSCISKLKSSHISGARTCTVKICKLPLEPKQSVHLQRFSQLDREEKSISQKQIRKFTLIHHKHFVR